MTNKHQIKKGPLVVALMMIAFLVAMESTVVVLATPIIARDLAGFELMSLVFSSYLVACAITTPIFGRLADRYGRKPMLFIGIVIFVIGCLLCGLAQNMIMLIAYRAVKGLGAGAIFNLAYTIIGDVFPVEKRAAILGALSAVWGVAGVAGPVIGGFLIEAFSWQAVFFVGIPIGIVSLLLLSFSLKENFTPPTYKRKLDHWAGIITRLSIFTNCIAFVTCIILLGIDVYIMLYLQDVLGQAPLIAGLAVLPMSFSWLAASYFSGKLAIRFGGKAVLISSAIIQVVAGALLVTLDQNSSLYLAIFYAFLTGFGLGGLLTVSTIIIQESVGYEKRGTAVGINSLVKTIGQAVGVSGLGIALNVYLAGFFANAGHGDLDTSNLLQGGTSDALGGTVDALVSEEMVAFALDSGIDLLFIIMLALSIATVVLALLMPRVQLGCHRE
ncbi:MAG: MFS transporter [Coriobacteriia bacterium]|nr:MFS transporter [Coriobacteriia bacterium]